MAWAENTAEHKPRFVSTDTDVVGGLPNTGTDQAQLHQGPRTTVPLFLLVVWTM